MPGAPLTDWYGLSSSRPSAYAEIIYQRFLERLVAYSSGSWSEDILRQHALRYLFPTIHLLKSPFTFPGMQRAVDLVRAMASDDSKKIVLYGDRDADGVTSASLLYLFCREQLKIGKERITALVPREEDKYGITPDVATRICGEKPDLLITLDCGSSNRTELEEIRKRTGCKTIIIDHHFIPPDPADYPDVHAFINPKLLPEGEFARDYCTAAITLRFVQAILYTYSREYNENVGIKTASSTLVIRNGVVTSEADFSACERQYFLLESASEAPAEKHDLYKIFEHTARENSEMRRLLDFYRKVPGAFSAAEIFNAVQSVSFRKSHAILAAYLPFAAIGLVADLMPIYADNRILVREGLNAMRQSFSALPMGLMQLLKKLNLAGAIVEQDLGFSVCPVINAAGRMGNAKLALNALTETDPLAAAKSVFALTQINEQRKEASQSSLELLAEALDKRSEAGAISVAVHANFHRGISGLIASKIAEKYTKPALVLVPDGECYRGSVRAFRNENVHGLIDALSDHLIQFGGHRQAAGFSVAADRIADFVDAVFETAEKHFAERAGLDPGNESIDHFRNFNPPLEIESKHMRMPLWDELLMHAPYGVMNPHPVVAVKKTGRVEVAALGKTGAHAKIKFASPADRNIEGVWFFHGGAADGVASKDDLVVSGEPQVGKFMGRTQYRLKITKVEDC